MPAAHKAARDTVTKALAASTPTHDAYRDKWNEYYSLHRNHTSLKEYIRNATNRESARKEVVREWRANLYIPLIFSAIETIVPRALSQNPTLSVKPRVPDASDAAREIKQLLEQQQADIGFDLKLLPTARRGFKYGLGVQKTYWERKTRTVRTTEKVREKGKLKRTEKAVMSEVVVREGPQVEDVDIWDFFWEPTARSVETSKYLIHRAWRDLGYVKKKIASGEWFPGEDGNALPPDEQKALIDEISGHGTSSGRTLSWSERDRARGVEGASVQLGSMTDHEVLEYHDGTKVITLLDRTFVAQLDETPFDHCEKPFQIFRPTMQEGEFVGIGEIEPIKHLQYELNTLRSQRRDNAAYVLNRVYAYAEGMVDAELFKNGPGALIPTAGDPRDTIFPIPVEDIPASSYREEEQILSDFDRATGIDESTAGAGAAGDTATGIQLVQGAANVRIALKTKMLNAETIRPTTEQFLYLDRQFIRKKKELRIDDSTEKDGYRWTVIDPEVIAAEVDVQPDAGSTEPENAVQKRNDALTLFNQLNGNPIVEQTKLAQYLLEQHDIGDSAEWIAPPPDEAVSLALSVVAEKLSESTPDQEKVIAFMDEVMADIREAEQEQEGQPAPAEENPNQAPVPA